MPQEGMDPDRFRHPLADGQGADNAYLEKRSITSPAILPSPHSRATDEAPPTTPVKREPDLSTLTPDFDVVDAGFSPPMDVTSPTDTTTSEATTSPTTTNNICPHCGKNKKPYLAYRNAARSKRLNTEDETCLSCWNKIKKQDQARRLEVQDERLGSPMKQRNASVAHAFGSTPKWELWAKQVAEEGSEGQEKSKAIKKEWYEEQRGAET
jgi:hypothetical protein